MTRTVRLLAAGLVGIVTVLAVAGSAFGAQGATVGIRPADPTESWIVTRAIPGQPVHTEAVIVNLTDRTQRVHVSAADAATTSDGTFTLASDAETPTGVGAWLRPGVGSLTLAAREERTVPIEIAVPAGATPGDHAGGVVVRPADPTETVRGDGVAIQVVERVGLRVYLRVPGRRDDTIAVTALATAAGGGGRIRRALGLPTQVDATFTARNSGNVGHSSVRARVELVRDGRVESARDVDLGTMLPGDERVATTRVPLTTWRPGAHELRVRVGDDPGATATTRVAVGPWRLVGAALGMTVLLGLGVVAWRRRPGRRATWRLTAGCLAACALSAPAVGPASAADATLGVVLMPGGLGASEPERLDLPPARVAGRSVTVTADLGPVEVLDVRGGAPGWGLVASAGPPRDALGRPMGAHLVIDPGAVEGDGPLPGGGGELSSPRTVMRAHPGRGRGRSRVRPRIALTVPADTPSGRYTTSLAFTVS